MNSNYKMESIWHSSELKEKANLVHFPAYDRPTQNEQIPEFLPSEYQMEIEAKFGITNIKLIGGGKFGSVFTAIQNESNEMVSFKAISATDTKLLSMLEFCKMAKDEIRIMQLLNHDNIVRYYDHLKILQPHYIVPIRYLIKMEYLDKTLGLATCLKSLTENQCLQVFKQVGAALEYMHCDKRIAHHDLKPNNIMMKKAKFFEDCIFKVIDFGLAKMYSTEMENTQDRSSRGSPLYMAPEKFTIPWIYNPFLTDSYAFGCCLLISVIGTDKFQSHWRNHLKKIPDSIVLKYVRNEPLISVLKGLMSLNPDKRLFVRDALKLVS